jgi:hypothetical protein
MTTIYRMAEVVAIWLGKAADESDLAIDVMRDWELKHDALFQELRGIAHSISKRIFSEDPYPLGPEGSKQQRAQEAITKLALRPWWTRAWVVQEGTIAHPSRTLIFCGNRNISLAGLRVTLYLRYMGNMGNGRRFPMT